MAHMSGMQTLDQAQAYAWVLEVRMDIDLLTVRQIIALAERAEVKPEYSPLICLARAITRRDIRPGGYLEYLYHDTNQRCGGESISIRGVKVR